MTIASAEILRCVPQLWHGSCKEPSCGTLGTLFAPPSTWHKTCMASFILGLA